eukprot:357808-Chlamydomonas_euryale.AAC.3
MPTMNIMIAPKIDMSAQNVHAASSGGQRGGVERRGQQRVTVGAEEGTGRGGGDSGGGPLDRAAP